MSQIKYNTNRANAKRASRDMLVKESEVAMKELTEPAQGELKHESTGDENRDKVRNDTANWLLLYMEKEKLPTPKAGSHEDQDELAIYINELPTITKETREKLQTLT